MSGQTSRRLRIPTFRLETSDSNGTANSTVIYDAAGDVVKWGAACLEKIEILPIQPNGVVTAVLTVSFVGLDVDADAATQ